jgi:RNA polymerase sigma-70 factor (ECF subfamily)
VSDTQDLVQDAVLKTLKHLQEFQPQREGALQGYLRQAIMNRIRDELRRAHRRPAAVDAGESVASEQPSPLAQTIGQEMVDRYEDALVQLRR